MQEYVNGILEEATEDINGKVVTPAAMNLFTVRENAEKLDDNCMETYHHLTAKQTCSSRLTDHGLLPNHSSNRTR